MAGKVKGGNKREEREQKVRGSLKLIFCDKKKFQHKTYNSVQV